MLSVFKNILRHTIYCCVLFIILSQSQSQSTTSVTENACRVASVKFPRTARTVQYDGDSSSFDLPVNESNSRGIGNMPHEFDFSFSGRSKDDGIS